MKIGILFSAYNSEKYIDGCLTPWFNLKNEFDIVIGCNSGMYSDYVNFGIEPKNKSTLKKLVEYDLDFLISTGPKSLLDENSSKNSVLHVLKNSCDIIWILDSDEFYTENEIRNIITYIQRTPEYDWYTVNFKNLTLTDRMFMDGFNPPRIFRTDRNGGINEFYFDNHITYNDGETFESKSHTSIPRTVAWVTHYSWLNGDIRSKEKITYQNNRFLNGCSFEWDSENNKLRFSKDFYNRVNLDIPILHEEIDIFSDEFTIDFKRSENKFYVQNIVKPQTLTFKIYDCITGGLIYETTMELIPQYNYFIYPSQNNFDSDENFKKFRVEVLKENQIIHNEFIHLKYE